MRTGLLWKLVGVVAVVSVLCGPARNTGHHVTDENNEQRAAHARSLVSTVPVAEVTGDLKGEQGSRRLRWKVALLVSADRRESVAVAVAEKTAELRTCMLALIASQSLTKLNSATVGTTAKEMERAFGGILFPGQDNPIKHVLFEEYTIQ